MKEVYKMKKKKEYKDLKEQYENNLNIMKNLEKTFEKKIEESKILKV